MYRYRSIIENPEKLRSMTGLTADEFHALVPIFHTAFEAYMKRLTIDGRVRYCRRYVSYANSPLPTTEDKLLFPVRASIPRRLSRFDFVGTLLLPSMLSAAFVTQGGLPMTRIGSGNDATISGQFVKKKSD